MACFLCLVLPNSPIDYSSRRYGCAFCLWLSCCWVFHCLFANRQLNYAYQAMQTSSQIWRKNKFLVAHLWEICIVFCRGSALVSCLRNEVLQSRSLDIASEMIGFLPVGAAYTLIQTLWDQILACRPSSQFQIDEYKAICEHQSIQGSRSRNYTKQLKTLSSPF